jgi:hypothetical protein
MFDVSVRLIEKILQNDAWKDPNWIRPSTRDRHSYGLHRFITDQQTGWSKYLIAEKFPNDLIIYRLGVTKNIVSYIKNRGGWPHVEPSSVGLPDWPKSNFIRRI